MEERGQQGTTIRSRLGEITFMSKIILIFKKVYFSYYTLEKNILSNVLYSKEWEREMNCVSSKMLH